MAIDGKFTAEDDELILVCELSDLHGFFPFLSSPLTNMTQLTRKGNPYQAKKCSLFATGERRAFSKEVLSLPRTPQFVTLRGNILLFLLPQADAFSEQTASDFGLAGEDGCCSLTKMVTWSLYSSNGKGSFCAGRAGRHLMKIPRQQGANEWKQVRF